MPLRTIISGDEECLTLLSVILFLLLGEVVLIDVFNFFSCGTLCLVLVVTRVVGLDAEETGVILVPVGLDGDEALLDFHLHEGVHIDVVNVELVVWDTNRGERTLVGQDAELLSVRIEGDVLDLSELLTGLDFKLSGHSNLPVGSSGDVEHFDQGVRGDDSHSSSSGFNSNNVTVLLGIGQNLLDFSGVGKDLKFVFTTLNDGLRGESADIRVAFEVSEELGPFGSLHIVDLGKLTVPEKTVLTTAVDSFDVHTEGHDNLEVRVG